MKIVIASDHTGLKLKQRIMAHYREIEFLDVGAFTEDSTDYPEWIAKACEELQQKKADSGIVICGTGIGASIAANKMKGIRAALCTNSFMSEMARRHNDANVLALGARVLGDELAIHIVDAWLKASYEGGRHQRRIDKITGLESTC